MTKTPLEAAQEFYASVHAGDFDRLFNAMSDDCCIEFYGPALIPFSGIFKGKEKCKIFFGHVANDVEIEEFSQAEFIAERNMVAVTGRLQMVLKATGRRYSADYAHIITTGMTLWGCTTRQSGRRGERLRRCSMESIS